MKLPSPPAALAAVVVALAASPAASPALRAPRHQTLEQRIAFERHVIRRDRLALRWFERHAATTLYAVRVLRIGPALAPPHFVVTASVPNLERRAASWREVRFRRRQARRFERLLARDEAARRASLLPAHYAGWRCITNGAYPGAPHEGDGYNGRYTGPLGMTTPWMGYYPPGSDWVHSPIVAVYWIAERVMARYRFAYSAMAGQWPETFPPCSRFF